MCFVSFIKLIGDKDMTTNYDKQIIPFCSLILVKKFGHL